MNFSVPAVFCGVVATEMNYNFCQIVAISKLFCTLCVCVCVYDLIGYTVKG